MPYANGGAYWLICAMRKTLLTVDIWVLVQESNNKVMLNIGYYSPLAIQCACSFPH